MDRISAISPVYHIAFVNHWIPRYKEELIQWLSARYPQDTSKFKQMNKKQLYAVYFNVKRGVK